MLIYGQDNSDSKVKSCHFRDYFNGKESKSLSRFLNRETNSFIKSRQSPLLSCGKVMPCGVSFLGRVPYMALHPRQQYLVCSPQWKWQITNRRDCYIFSTTTRTLVVRICMVSVFFESQLCLEVHFVMIEHCVRLTAVFWSTFYNDWTFCAAWICVFNFIAMRLMLEVGKFLHWYIMYI